MAKKSRTKLSEFDKYDYYLRSVQAPDADVDFFLETYRSLAKRSPETLREDFCGAFAVCCDWVQRSKKLKAFGVDLDLEPISWGQKHLLPKLKPEQQSRIQILNQNVLDKNLPKVDVIAAQNFSYFIFKKREQLRDYFRNCLLTLNPDGLLIADCFGGSACYEPNEEETKFKGFSYFWEQSTFNPITSEAEFHIHYKRDGEKRRERVFSYDWRLWSLAEIREIMEEAGFPKTHVYWEGTTRKGGGNGRFIATEFGDYALSWIAYVVGQKK